LSSTIIPIIDHNLHPPQHQARPEKSTTPQITTTLRHTSLNYAMIYCSGQCRKLSAA
jgi:hypothetical protein